jgi:heptosyltransferase-2
MSALAGFRHLAVRLPNWLGDTVMALPALRALRRGLPECRITLVGPWAPLLATQGVAEGHAGYPRGWRQRLAAVAPLRRLQADAALLLPNSIESALAAWLWGVRWIVGYATDGRRALLTHGLPPPAPRRHQVDEYLGLLSPLGIEPDSAIPTWIFPDEAKPGVEAALALLGSRGAPALPRVGIHLGAAFGPSKLWAVERIVGLCQALRQRQCLPVLLGAPGDGALAETILAEAGPGVLSLVGKDSPEILPALLMHLDALVSTDTGVAHLGAAVGTPVVTLFGPTDPALTAPRGLGQTEQIWKPPPCAPCFLPACPIEHPCMRVIQVEEVLEAVERCLAWVRE